MKKYIVKDYYYDGVYPPYTDIIIETTDLEKAKKKFKEVVDDSKRIVLDEENKKNGDIYRILKDTDRNFKAILVDGLETHHTWIVTKNE